MPRTAAQKQQSLPTSSPSSRSCARARNYDLEIAAFRFIVALHHLDFRLVFLRGDALIARFIFCDDFIVFGSDSQWINRHVTAEKIQDLDPLE